MGRHTGVSAEPAATGRSLRRLRVGRSGRPRREGGDDGIERQVGNSHPATTAWIAAQLAVVGYLFWLSEIVGIRNHHLEAVLHGWDWLSTRDPSFVVSKRSIR